MKTIIRITAPSALLISIMYAVAFLAVMLSNGYILYLEYVTFAAVIAANIRNILTEKGVARAVAVIMAVFLVGISGVVMASLFVGFGGI